MKSSVYFVGLCGIGISGMAKLYASKGFSVSGSDMAEPSEAQMKEFIDYNITFYQGHPIESLEGVDIVVHSTAIKLDNCILKEAERRGLVIYDRATALSNIAKEYKKVVAITGSHGKTTTTGMTFSICSEASKPTLLCGGRINEYKSNFVKGEEEILILEADESDGTFQKIDSDFLIVTNLDDEHSEYYGGFDKMLNKFRGYINTPRKANILCGDDSYLKEMGVGLANTFFCGFGEDNDFIIKNVKEDINGAKFDLFNKRSQSIFASDLRIGQNGYHNISNAACACLASIMLEGYEVAQKSSKGGLKKFLGIDRRFSVLGNFIANTKAIVVDDYAHHHKEVSCLLEATKVWMHSREMSGKVIAVFQPHRYSRLAKGMTSVANALMIAAEIIIMPVYEAGEKREDYKLPNDKGYADSERLLYIMRSLIKDKISDKHVSLVTSEEALRKKLSEIANGEDVICCIGAGNITNYARNLAVQHKSSFSYDKL